MLSRKRCLRVLAFTLAVVLGLSNIACACALSSAEPVRGHEHGGHMAVDTAAMDAMPCAHHDSDPCEDHFEGCAPDASEGVLQFVIRVVDGGAEGESFDHEVLGFGPTPPLSSHFTPLQLRSDLDPVLVARDTPVALRDVLAE